MNKKFIAVVSIIIIFVGAVFLGKFLDQKNTSNATQGDKTKVTVFKSPTCGCCVGHVAYLKKHGFEVETINTLDMSSVKEKYQIPPNMQSCHTTLLGDYFIEGHIPIEAIDKLLTGKPTIDGITLPGMPAGSPGMPGFKRGPFLIYSLLDGAPSEFISL